MINLSIRQETQAEPDFQFLVSGPLLEVKFLNLYMRGYSEVDLYYCKIQASASLRVNIFVNSMCQEHGSVSELVAVFLNSWLNNGHYFGLDCDIRISEVRDHIIHALACY